MAGTSVDIALFPLDTIKTRLQSAHGFFKAGGFRGVYSGLSAAAAGSAPGGCNSLILVPEQVHVVLLDPFVLLYICTLCVIYRRLVLQCL